MVITMYEKIKRFAQRSTICGKLIYSLFLIYGFFYYLLCRLLSLFPVQENKIICCSFKGRYYADNPKYITEALLRCGGDYDIVWLLLKDNDVELPQGVRRITYGSFEGLKELMTAAVWIDGNTKQYGVYKRKRQLFIETWHGSYGLKKIAWDLKKLPLVDTKTYSHNVKLYDLMISNSRRVTEIYRRAFGYGGEMLEFGSPRNDVFFREPAPFIQKVKEYFKLEEKNLALYAPTWRSDFNIGFLSLNYEQIRKTLGRRFGGDWAVLVRMHPYNMMEEGNTIGDDGNILNATYYNDMQELLVACDVLITDYSSCMFDFVTRGKPCFLYAPDVEEYRNDRDYYFDIYDLPFPLGRNTAELEQKILEFDEEVYQEKLKALHEQVGLNETGHASEYAAQYIEKWLSKEGYL